MKISFKYKYDNSCHSFMITGDYIKGDIIRSEGGVKMSLKNDTLFIFEQNNNFHNDHKALIFILTFYPIIPKNIDCDIEFNFNVTEKFYNAIKTHTELKKINILNTFDSEDYANNDMLLCFGGGIDSTAASVLLPTIKKIKQINLNEVVDESDDVIDIKSNIRDLYTRWGLPLWVTIFIFPIIFNSKYIITGTQYNSAYLTNGMGYRNICNNAWYSLFNELSIHILSMSFISEITTAELVVKNNKCKNLEFCYFSSRKRCNRCTKCLRKYLELSLFDEKYLKEVEKFDLSTIDFINFFNTDWLYFGDCFKYCIDYHLNNGVNTLNILKLKNYLDYYDISDVSFLNKYYEDDFQNMKYPNEIKEEILLNLNDNNIQKMSLNEIESMINFKNKKIKMA